MALPFTSEQFLDGFGRFNTAVWPLHVAAWGVAAVVLLFAIRGGRAASRVVPLGLASLWLAAAALQGIGMRGVMATALPFAAVFALEAALLAGAGISGRLVFGSRRGPAAALGLVLVAYAAIGYAIVGALAGHRYPREPVFGVAPCPNTIFTFGVLLLAARAVPMWVLAIPILWSIVAISAASSLGVPQDTALPIAAAATVAALAWRSRHARHGGAVPPTPGTA